MDKDELSSTLTNWIINFVEVSNKNLNGWAPCPYVRQARIKNQIEFLHSEITDFNETINNGIILLDKFEVIVIYFNHTEIDPVVLQEFVESKNKDIMQNNYVILEDHPYNPEYINGVKMNFGHCGLLILQKLDKLNVASENLKRQGYYNVWSDKDLDNVVNWRINT